MPTRLIEVIAENIGLLKPEFRLGHRPGEGIFPTCVGIGISPSLVQNRRKQARMKISTIVLLALALVAGCSWELPPTVVREAGTDAADSSAAEASISPDVEGVEVIIPDVPPARCEADVDCDDRDESTEDRCDMTTGVCHHTRTVVMRMPEFDPATRQDQTYLCEKPSVCPTGNLVRLRTPCGTYQGRRMWSELGYFLDVAFEAPPASHVIRLAPRLSAGDPRDTFLVRVVVNNSMTPSFERTMTVADIEGGFDVNVMTNGDILVTFRPTGASLFSRTLQWDLPVGSITDGAGNALSTCLQVGDFVPIPQHGFLHLQEGPGGQLECAGSPLRADPTVAIMVGWAREMGSPVLFYVDAPPAPQRRLYQFATAREAEGWINPPQSLDTLCTSAFVLEDGAFARLTGTNRVNIGVRPGVYVEWSDGMGTRHQGIADRAFTLFDFTPQVGESYVCTNYHSIGGGMLCGLDVTDILSRYTVRSPVSGTVISPASMFRDAELNRYNP